ncbi:hypothetical protein [Xanthomarina sp. F2636L]|uniref:hypothetical protein n=1 Tax=Xanthomarina sp. F2636L TaxID=2996018 RepID=UPI00225DDC4E|nr:hypothetical protein [Xanthomarina sp. F2636L]MCX7551774.1 hypothetical protein [Xanthomarina sp. F2636L]
MKKLPSILAIVFFLSTLSLIYVFVFKGSVVETSDNRVGIELSQSNADFALKEMRGFLESIQQINERILNKDSEQIYVAARQSGANVVHEAPQGMMASLPIGFKKMGLNVHAKFDEIADSIKANNNFNYAQKELNTLLNSCITCHRTYKIEVRN